MKNTKKYNKEYYKRNKAKIKKNSTMWAKTHRDLINQRSRIRSRSLKGKFSELEKSARVRGFTMLITFEQYVSLISSGVCYYCGTQLNPCGHNLDRKDNKLGYMLSNVVPCCGKKYGSQMKSCNSRKGNLEQAGFTYPRTVELLLELLSEERNNAISKQGTAKIHVCPQERIGQARRGCTRMGRQNRFQDSAREESTGAW